MKQERDTRLPKGKTSSPERLRDNHCQPDGDIDWWDSPEFKRQQKRREKSEAQAAEQAKPSKPQAPLKEMHTIVPLFFGGIVLGLLVGGPVTLMEFTLPVPRTEKLMAPLYVIGIAAIGYWLSRASRSVSEKLGWFFILPMTWPFLFLANIYSLISISIGNFILGWFGYRGSNETAYGAEHPSDRELRVTAVCPGCNKKVAVPPERVGFYFDCPRCSKSFQVSEEEA